MNIETLIADLRADYHKYNDMGLIDPMSVYRWANIALKRFGGLIAEPSARMVYSRGKQAVLPDGFFDLIKAYKCEPWAYDCDKKVIHQLQNEFAWIERTERGHTWCSCDECCEEEFCKTVTEKLYINTFPVTFHYKNPQLLKEVSHTSYSSCKSDCEKCVEDYNMFDVSVKGGILYCHFDGPIYIKYTSTPIDGNGLPVIPDTPLGRLSDYVEVYIKKRLFEVALVNSGIPGTAELYKEFSMNERELFPQAMSDCRMMGVSMKRVLEKHAENNRKVMQVYENMWNV